jgi:hypothetical protein
MTERIAGNVGTSFSSETTQQGKKIAPGKVPELMSEEGEHLASVSAPESAFVVRTSNTPAVRGEK